MGLKVYVDGLLAGVDPNGRTRIYTAPQVDPFTEIVVGKANDDMRINEIYPDVEIDHLHHWDSIKTQQEIMGLIGE